MHSRPARTTSSTSASDSRSQPASDGSVRTERKGVPVLHMRIDNRLIHGQVTVTWVGSVGANRLIVSNDQVATDPVQKMLLPAAARGVSTSVMSVEDGLAYVASEQGQREKIMIIAKLPTDGLRLLQGGLKPAHVNVGNQARSEEQPAE